ANGGEPAGDAAAATVPAPTRSASVAMESLMFMGATVETRDERSMTALLHLTFMSPDHDSPVRVLIVEDDLRMAGLVRRGLLKEGFAADVASTGEDALVAAGAHEYD